MTKRWLKAAIYVLYISSLVFLAVDSYSLLTKEEEDVSPSKITLTFRHFWVQQHNLPVERIIRGVIEQFEKEHPFVKIKFEGIDQEIHRDQKLKSEMVTGTQPDIFALFGGAEIEPYVYSNRLLDLTEFVEEHQLIDRFKDLSLWTFDGRIYGLPLEENIEPLYYNKSIFSELSLSPPETIEELFTVVEVLKQNGYIPFALGNEERWPAAIYAHYFMERYAGPKQILSLIKGESSFINEPYLQAFYDLAKLVEMGAFPENMNYLGAEDAIRLFVQGEAGMYLNGSWDITLFQNDEVYADFAKQVGVVSFPALTQGGSRSLAGGSTFGLGVSADLDEKQQQAALALLEMIYHEDVQLQLVHEALRIPTLRLEVNEQQTGPVFPLVVDLSEKTEEKFVPYDHMLAPEVKQSFLTVIAQLLEGQLTPETALNELQKSSDSYWMLRQRSTQP